MIIENLIHRAHELERSVMSSSEEPEIGVNELTGKISISSYDAEKGVSIWLEDVCRITDVDLGQLRMRLNQSGLFYCL